MVGPPGRLRQENAYNYTRRGAPRRPGRNPKGNKPPGAGTTNPNYADDALRRETSVRQRTSGRDADAPRRGGRSFGSPEPIQVASRLPGRILMTLIGDVFVY